MIILISIFFILIILFLTSKLKIIIEDCQKDKSDLKIKYQIKIGIYILGILKIFGFSISESGLQVLGFKIPYEKLNFQKIDVKNTNFKKLKKSIPKLNLKIEQLDFNLNIGCKEIGVVTFSTFVISSLLSLVCSKFGNLKKCYYKINPFFNINLLEFQLQSVISIKLIHILIFAVNMRKNKFKKKMSFSMKNLISV